MTLQICDNSLIDCKKIALDLQKNSHASFYVVGNPVNEKCCSDIISSDHMKADAFIHVGHACLSYITELPTFYIFSKHLIDVDEFCETFSIYFSEKSRIFFYYDVGYDYVIGKFIMFVLIYDKNIFSIKEHFFIYI